MLRDLLLIILLIAGFTVVFLTEWHPYLKMSQFCSKCGTTQYCSSLFFQQTEIFIDINNFHFSKANTSGWTLSFRACSYHHCCCYRWISYSVLSHHHSSVKQPTKIISQQKKLRSHKKVVSLPNPPLTIQSNFPQVTTHQSGLPGDSCSVRAWSVSSKQTLQYPGCS